MNTQKKGRLGEELAVKYLLGLGFEILERNYRHGRLEIDIIGQREDRLFFFEVKSSFSQQQDSPLLRIDEAKLRRIYRAAFGYAASKRLGADFEVAALSVEIEMHLRRARIEMVPCGLN